MRTLIRLAFLAALCEACWLLWLGIVALASFVIHEAGWGMLLASAAFTGLLVVFIALASHEERTETKPEPLFTRTRLHGPEDAA